MFLPREIGDLFTSIIRRQSTDSTSDSAVENIPAQCFDVCNSAALEAQHENNNATLCAPNSTFLNLLDSCSRCIEQNVAAGNGTASPETVAQDFQDWLGFCGSDNGNIGSPVVAILAGYDFSTTATATITGDAQTNIAATPGGSSSTLTPTGSPTDTATINGDGGGDGSGSPDIGVLVPAVVVPGVVVFVLLVGCAFMFRRRKQRIQIPRHGALGDGYETKAQLHADPFRSELDGRGLVAEAPSRSDGASTIAELPARELVGSEMDSTSNR
ncbi:hypothetical protein BJY01DRAFT_246426 [Aspergillus pseudoustus]|uniref:Uncharacterized protein n=1 Tax=Aspergillus pseudoustus TaxID=1810923 RepID=A0ABR4K9E7_9EURO